jgi:renalase
MPTLAIVGSGLSGLSAASVLVHHPHAQRLTTLVLDKGQHPGGRMASHIETEHAWDTGAQYARADSLPFMAWVNQFVPEVISWPEADRFVIPGGFRHLAERASMGLNLCQKTTLQHIRWDNGSQRWQLLGHHSLSDQLKTWWADGLLLTCPVPQAIALVSPYLPHDHDLQTIQYTPNLTLQVKTDCPLTKPYRSSDGVVGWVADNQPKWPHCNHSWTVQSTPQFATDGYNLEEAEITRQLLSATSQLTDTPLDKLVPIRLKHWRYALVTKPYHLPYYAHPQLPLWMAGDGFISPRLEGAWQSGQAVAKAMLAAYLDPARH